MVKVVYGEKLSGLDLDEYFGNSLHREKNTTQTHIEYTDETSGYHLTMDGKNFVWGGGTFDGTVKELRLTDDNDKPLMTVTGGNFSGEELTSAYGLDGSAGMLEYVMKGNDTLTGSKAADDIYSGAGKDTIDGGKGNDLIEGGLGNDKIKGGAGSDDFMFTAGDGKDTISDFDAKGGDLKQDYLLIASDTEYDVSYSKKGALVEFDDGDSIMLLGLKKGEFTDADVHHWDVN